MALSAKQRRAARYLGLYMTQVEAARRVVVNPRTIRRWLTDDAEFAALVQSEREAGNNLQASGYLRRGECCDAVLVTTSTSVAHAPRLTASFLVSGDTKRIPTQRRSSVRPLGYGLLRATAGEPLVPP
jgi:hypothetical protein